MTGIQPHEPFWQCRADELVAAITLVLSWTHAAGLRMTPQEIAAIVTLQGLGEIVDHSRLPVQRGAPAGGIPLPQAPELTGPLRRHLQDTPGFDPARPCASQSPVVTQQHGYVLFAARDRLTALAA